MLRCTPPTICCCICHFGASVTHITDGIASLSAFFPPFFLIPVRRIPRFPMIDFIKLNNNFPSPPLVFRLIIFPPLPCLSFLHLVFFIFRGKNCQRCKCVSSYSIYRLLHGIHCGDSHRIVSTHSCVINLIFLSFFKNNTVCSSSAGIITLKARGILLKSSHE